MIARPSYGASNTSCLTKLLPSGRMRRALGARGARDASRFLNAQPRRLQHALPPESTSRPVAPIDAFSRFVAEPRRVRIVGAPLSHGQKLLGVDRGPESIRQHGLVERLKKDEWIVEDVRDLDIQSLFHSDKIEQTYIGSVQRAKVVANANRMLFEVAAKHSAEDALVLTLGGDHSIGIGSVAATLKAKPDAAVVWVDAHADINTPAESLSGNIHGMVLSFLMGLGNARKTVGFEWMDEAEVPYLSPTRLVYVGLRDVDLAERRYIKQLGIKAYSMHEVDKYGIGKVMEMAFDHLLDRAERPIHLSFDIDAVDPAFAPSTGTRVAGGLSYREAYFICESVASTGCLAAMDLVEVNPLLAPVGANDTTVDMAVGLIASALGNRII